jgi:hypothetical protein
MSAHKGRRLRNPGVRKFHQVHEKNDPAMMKGFVRCGKKPEYKLLGNRPFQNNSEQDSRISIAVAFTRRNH